VKHLTAEIKASELREVHSPGRKQELPDRRFLELIVLYATGGVDLTFPQEKESLLGVVVQFETTRSVFAERQIVIQEIVQFGLAEVVALLDDVYMWQYDSHGSLRSLSSMATYVWNPLPPFPERAISMPEMPWLGVGVILYLVVFQ
jgi:hypothetical protein